jgi:DnaJ-domain-containing protein 1
MAEGALSIKLRCASWPQLATIYKRDLSRGTMFLRAQIPPAIGTTVRIDLALPSATVIALTGVVHSHINDPQRGLGVELKLAPIPTGSVWLIESALASEHKRATTPAYGTPVTAAAGALHPHQMTGAIPVMPAIPAITDSAEVSAAEQDLIKALVSEAESLKKLNPFLVLGVGYEASDADVRAAFGNLTKRYHPDRFARYESDELRQVAAEIFILIRDAYRRLGDATARAQVLQSLGKPGSAPRAIPGPPRIPPTVPPPAVRSGRAVPPSTPPASLPAGSLAPPPIPVLAALPANPATAPTAPVPVIRRGGPSAPAATRPEPRPGTAAGPGARPSGSSLPAPQSAEPSRAKRAATDPGAAAPSGRRSQQIAVATADPAEIAALEALIDDGKLDDALATYRALGKQFPHDRSLRAGVELCEGLRAMAGRDRLEAAQRFEAALEIDPSNERAARELADMRRQATNERKGLLSRLMGKKEP